ncbi:MAG TPA: hypothetical protein DEA22_06255 [Blastocatellia bacterium]|nr:hypothetical protein [Blastocatellia bacterium]
MGRTGGRSVLPLPCPKNQASSVDSARKWFRRKEPVFKVPQFCRIYSSYLSAAANQYLLAVRRRPALICYDFRLLPDEDSSKWHPLLSDID